MEGLTRAASPRLDQYRNTCEIYQLEGVWYAWKRTADRCSGELTHAPTSDELADKLAG